MAIDKGPQLGDYDTITREEYHRVNGTAPAPAVLGCLECGKELTPVQVKRGGKFCTQRCSGNYNARQPAKPKAPKVKATFELNGEVPTRTAVPLDLHPDDSGCIPIAAALVDVLLAIPGCRLVEVWVGPIGPIQVRS